jgi:hypothetical protein
LQFRRNRCHAGSLIPAGLPRVAEIGLDRGMTSDSGQHASLILVIVNAQKGITMSRESAATTSEVSRGDKAHINLALEIGLLTALSLICSSSFTLMKVAVETIPPLTMTSARVRIAALLPVLTARMLDSSLAYGC